MNGMDIKSHNLRLTPHLSRLTCSISREKGFSLIELLVVIALVAILSAIAFPNFQEMLIKIRVNGAVKGLAMEMNLTKVRAISENRPYRINFATSAPWEYKVLADLNRDGTIASSEVVKTVSLSSGIQFGVSSGTKKTNNIDDAPGDGVSFSFGADYGTFDPDGRGNYGSVYLIPSVDATSGRKDRMRAIAISQPTYKVKVYRHTGSTWVGF